ncbi:hypothetical protein [Conexibacter sp. CPCC 206217]|uniref:hypothetical protein n=1 Tax=Conexibacter sp. CPCC 206217 TaxID=3064574 RepID=UPI00272CE439|nr:hypothetical protein [Conexibacter sp. CPCC 206217]
MGYSNYANARALRGALLAAALVAGLLTALLGAATPARAVELGISDSNATTLSEPYWDGLGLKRARIVLPWDVVDTRGPAGTRRREDFEAFRAGAAAKGVTLLIAFAASADIRNPDGSAIAPTPEQFADGFAKFRNAYPDVTTIAPWNEPNNPDGTTYPLGADPALAAQYFLIAQSICPSGCTLVAGDFAGIAGDDAYVDAYQTALAAGGVFPAVWAFHAHSDINAFQAGGPDSARISRYYLSKFQGPWANSRIWIDEIGARFRDPGGIVWGDDSQAQATQFLLGLATLDPRIDQIYYYNYSNQCATPSRCAQQDRGLVSPSPFDGQPLDYDGINRPRSAYNVIAARGPVIPPAAPVPPVVAITTPAQSAALNTATPTFSGTAAFGGRAAPTVMLQIFPGVSGTVSSTPAQTISTPLAAGAWSLRSAALPDGAYTARASQQGNPSSSGISQDVVFSVDTVPPTSTITGAPPAQTGSRLATLSFTASEAGSTFTCSVDRAAYRPCAAPLRLAHMRLGSHSVRVRAADPAGNVQTRPTLVSWRVVSLASALLPRTGELGAAFSSGVPLTVACADSCRIDARLYMPRTTAARAGIAGRGLSKSDPARPAGKASSYLVVGGAKLVRTRAGSGALALRLRAGSASALSATRSVGVRIGFTLRPKNSKPTAVSRPVTLVRAGALAALAAKGLPATVACASACSTRTALWVPQTSARALRAPGRSVAGGRRTGLPNGRYVSLGSATVTRRSGGASDLTLVTPRAIRGRLPRLPGLSVRAVARISGPGTPASMLSWPLALPR